MRSIKNIKKIYLIIPVILILLAILINYSFFKPTKINSFIASKIYNTPANSYFDDDNFYQCVVDAYNEENNTDLPYTTILTNEELASIKRINCRNVPVYVDGEKVEAEKITTVTGIEKLINVTSIDLYNNDLTNINLSQNIKLTWLDISNNHLSIIDLSNNKHLTYIDLDNNDFSSIDISNNLKLETLRVRYNPIETIDLSKNVNLVDLTLGSTQQSKPLQSIDLSKNINLESLYLYGTGEIKLLDLSNNIKLKGLSIQGSNHISSLNLKNNINLSGVIFQSTKLETLDLSSLPIKTAYFSSNLNLSTINLSNTELSNFYIHSFAGKSALLNLNISNCKLKTLKIDSETALQNLYISSNELEELDITKNKNLSTLDVSNNKLKKIDTTNNTNLTYLDISNNNLTELEISNNQLLEQLYASNNQLISIDISENPKLKNLSVSNNQLTTIDVSKNIDLTNLYLHSNPLRLKNIYLFVNDIANKNDDIKLPEESTEFFITYETENKSIAIYEDGKIKGIKPGNTKLIATLNGVKNSSASNDNMTVEGNITVYNIISTKYKIGNNYIYIGDETNKDVILSNIIIDGTNVLTKEIKDGKLLIKDNGEILKEFNIVSINSNKYDLSKDYIYTGTSELNQNDISVIKGSKEIKDNKLLIKYGDEILKEYNILKIDFKDLNVTGKNILLTENIPYETFINNITTSEGLSYKIFNNEEEVIDGNISIGMKLNVYYETEIIDIYNITDEFIDLSLLNIDEDKKLIKESTLGLKIKDFKEKISTSGTVTITDKNNKTLTDTDIIQTGAKVKIELSTETYEYTLSVKGDLTGDGKVEIGDVSRVYQYFRKKITMEDYYILAGDVASNDSKIQIGDVSRIYQYFRKKINKL